MTDVNFLKENHLKASPPMPMKTLRLLSSARSTAGATRVAQLLPVFCSQLDSVPQSISSDEVILAHNTVKVPESLRGNTIFYALQNLVKVILQDEKRTASFRKKPPLAIFTNTETAASDLRKHGISASAIYRPNKLKFPKDFVPLPEKPKVLLYWKSDHPPMAHYHTAVEALIKSLPEVEFWTFPDSEPPTDAPNVKALGRVQFSNVLPYVDGMVRISDRYDYGRSTFDVLAQGRWVVYNDMPNEKFTYSALLEEMAAFIRKLIDDRSNDKASALHSEIAAYFNEESLRRRWASSFKPFLDKESATTGQRISLSRFCSAKHKIEQGTLSIDRLTGKINIDDKQSHFQIRQVSKESSKAIGGGGLLLNAGTIYEISLITYEEIQSWLFMAGKSPNGYFITTPMPTVEFEKCNSIHGFLHPEQGLALYHAASAAGQEKSLVEIGAYHGKSTNYLATGAVLMKSQVYSIDTFENHAMTEGAMQTLDFYTENTARFRNIVHPIQGFSHDVVDRAPEAIAYLFIDGDHSIKGCASDIKYYFDRVAKGEIIAFDDYFDKSTAKRVKTVVDYFLEIGILSFVTEFKKHAITVKNEATAVLFSHADDKVGTEILGAIRSGTRAFKISTETLMDFGSAEGTLAETAVHIAANLFSLNFTQVPPEVRSRCTLLLLNYAPKNDILAIINSIEQSSAPFREIIVTDKEAADEALKFGVNVRYISHNDLLEEVASTSQFVSPKV